jgi:hypothetical protein
MNDSFQTRVNASKSRGGLAGIVRGMFCALAIAVGCGDDNYIEPPGFGDDEDGAIAYIEDVLAQSSYSSITNVNAQFRNPDTGEYFNVNYQVLGIGSGGEEIYVVYGALTSEQAAGITARMSKDPAMPPPLIWVLPTTDQVDITTALEDAINSQ